MLNDVVKQGQANVRFYVVESRTASICFYGSTVFTADDKIDVFNDVWFYINSRFTCVVIDVVLV